MLDIFARNKWQQLFQPPNQTSTRFIYDTEVKVKWTHTRTCVGPVADFDAFAAA